ncbi:hypothetical protein ACYPKM_05090 [Pseudomonas aeruginosa]
MSAKRAAQAIADLDCNFRIHAGFIHVARQDDLDDVEITKKIYSCLDSVRGTWTLSLAAQSAGVTEEAVLKSLAVLIGLPKKVSVTEMVSRVIEFRPF